MFFIIFSVYLTKQSKNYISIHFSTELKPPEDIILNDRKSTSLSIGWKTPKGPFIYYVITFKGEGKGDFTRTYVSEGWPAMVKNKN